jgi:uncharacterized membrane protein
MTVAPLQIVFLGLRGEEQRSEVTKALRTLSDRGAIRVLDIAYATKQEDGTFTPIQQYSTMTDQERQQVGTVVGALVGLGYGGFYGGKEGAKQGARMGAEIGTQMAGDGVVASFAQEDFGESVEEVRDHIRELAADVPPGATTAIALVEHRWMLELKDQLQKAGIVVLGSGMIRPRSLVMLGSLIATAQQATAVQ